MRQVFFLLVIVLVGAAVLAPVLALAGFDPMPGDFIITLADQRFTVPTIWSLCASSALGLLYWFVRR